MRKNKELKVCFAASSGGHYEQLLMLKPLMEKHASFVVTEKTSYKTQIDNEAMYYLHQVNIKEKPDVVITTGVLAMIPLCLLAKLFRKKLIYIESFAKVTSATETGKLLYKFADRFYVQWKPMLEIYPKAIYLGGIY